MFQTAFLKSKLVLICLIVLCSCSTKDKINKLPYYNTAEFTPVFLNSKDAKNKITHTINAFSFTNQNGEEVSEKTTEGKIHIANFFFTSCGSICPAMMKNMKLVHEKFAADTGVIILSFSVAPWIDSVGKLKKYAVIFGYDFPNWHLLTGKKADIYSLARQSYFAEEDLGFSKDRTDFLHTEHFLLVDKKRRIRGIYNGTLQLEAEQLIKDIQILKQEDE